MSTRYSRQRTTPEISAVAFTAVERQNSGSGGSDNSRNPGDESGSNDHVVLHGVTGSGTIFEASTFGVVWNAERDSSGPAGVPAEAAAAERGWHVCADLEASLVVRDTVLGGLDFLAVPPVWSRHDDSNLSSLLSLSITE